MAVSTKSKDLWPCLSWRSTCATCLMTEARTTSANFSKSSLSNRRSWRSRHWNAHSKNRWWLPRLRREKATKVIASPSRMRCFLRAAALTTKALSQSTHQSSETNQLAQQIKSRLLTQRQSEMLSCWGSKKVWTARMAIEWSMTVSYLRN